MCSDPLEREVRHKSWNEIVDARTGDRVHSEASVSRAAARKLMLRQC